MSSMESEITDNNKSTISTPSAFMFALQLNSRSKYRWQGEPCTINLTQIVNMHDLKENLNATNYVQEPCLSEMIPQLVLV